MKANKYHRQGMPDAQPQRPLQRFRPPPGQRLTMECIRGQWIASGAVAGAGMFAVRWSTKYTDWWATVHDFTRDDQHRLIEACRLQDAYTGHPAYRTGGYSE